MIDRMFRRERHHLVRAVDGTAAREDEVRGLDGPGELEDHQRRREIGVQIVEWRFDGMPDSGLRREMNDPIDASILQRRHRRWIRKVHFLERESIMSLQPRETARLECGIVVVVERIDAQHIVPPRQQRGGDMMADEAGSAGDEDLHGGTLRRPARDTDDGRCRRPWYEIALRRPPSASTGNLSGQAPPAGHEPEVSCLRCD